MPPAPTLKAPGSDAGSLRTRAEPDGGGWTITGTKQWITNGAHAGTVLLFARSDPDAPGARGVSAFVLDGEQVLATKEHEKLGLHSSSTADLALDDVFVPAHRMLGERARGFEIAKHTLDGGRIGIAAQAVGIAQAALPEQFAGWKMSPRILPDPVVERAGPQAGFQAK